MVAQVDLPNLFIFKQFFRFTFSDYLARIHNIGALADTQGFPNIMVGYQYADAKLGKMLDDRIDIHNGKWVDPGERFIKQDKVWPGCQRPGDFNTAALTP